jgi:hypothetical protein
VNLAAGLQRINQHPTWYSVPRLPFPFELSGLPSAPAEAAASCEARSCQAVHYDRRTIASIAAPVPPIRTTQ